MVWPQVHPVLPTLWSRHLLSQPKLKKRPIAFEPQMKRRFWITWLDTGSRKRMAKYAAGWAFATSSSAVRISWRNTWCSSMTRLSPPSNAGTFTPTATYWHPIDCHSSIDIYWHLLTSIDIYWLLLTSIDIYWLPLVHFDIFAYTPTFTNSSPLCLPVIPLFVLIFTSHLTNN